ncbi:hypothetical protein FRC08_005118 [Ceratobasidium sp. 394]|nr:hypothetical protein FRC08_005118 [Ceratobasidium sp. 394]
MPVMSRPIRLLSIDGGGIQGLAALVIIRELMSRICGGSSTQHPCKYFDLIVGTGIGGLIAIMLGRLRMSVDEAMEHLSEIASQVFSKKKLWGEGSYKATILEKIVGQMVSKYAGGVDARIWEETVGDEGCKT